MKKRVWILMTAMLLLAGPRTIFASPAEEESREKYGTGLLPLEGKEILWGHI